MDPVILPGHEPMDAMLPRHIRDRIRLCAAYRDALGYLPEDEPEDEPSGEPCGESLTMVCCAAIGLFCGVPGPSLRQCRYDVVEYGEFVFDVIGTTPQVSKALFTEGTRLIGEAAESIPSLERVEEEADPFEETTAPGGGDSPASE